MSVAPNSGATLAATVVLAAGAGRRLGGVAKAALRLGDGRSYLHAIVDTGRAAGIDRWVVVVGPPHEDETRALAESLDLPVVRNPNPERGMSSSVAIGFEYARQHFDRCACALLWPVDHARVALASVRAVLAQADAERVVIADFEGRGGHPSAFGRALWDALAACTDAPRGARTVIDGWRERGADAVLRLAVDDSGVIADVDTPQALARLNDGRRPNEVEGR